MLASFCTTVSNSSLLFNRGDGSTCCSLVQHRSPRTDTRATQCADHVRLSMLTSRTSLLFIQPVQLLAATCHKPSQLQQGPMPAHSILHSRMVRLHTDETQLWDDHSICVLQEVDSVLSRSFIPTSRHPGKYHPPKPRTACAICEPPNV